MDKIINAYREAENQSEVFRVKEQARRMKYALEQLREIGIVPFETNDTTIKFHHKGEVVRFYPFTGWASGKTIKDKRGIKNLINQLK